MKSILIPGGAGFAGSNLALLFKAHFPNVRIVALDNLKRRGSELNIPRLRAAGIEFVHGDVRVKEDLLEVGATDLLIDCSAEPSVLAGLGGSPEYVIQTNLVGTANCLEYARIYNSAVIFLSTSRVYPVAPLNKLHYTETETRFELSESQTTPGASSFGINEDFPLRGARSMYGASKLASELLLEEYVDSYGIKGIVNRCGVLTGPWQMGKVDQGVIVLWVAKHLFKQKLSYIGYGGKGKQVRDILHIHDLFTLLMLQLKAQESWRGEIYNVGGGKEVSLSLRELTALCVQSTGNTIPISEVVEDRPNDLRIYLTDARRASSYWGWSPKHSPEKIIGEITSWIHDNRVALEPILA